MSGLNIVLIGPSIFIQVEDPKMTKENDAPKQQAPTQIIINAQYIKDLSFENPNAPFSLLPSKEAPKINIEFNVTANDLDVTDGDASQSKGDGEAKNRLTEITMIFKAEAVAQNKTSFVIELSYAGVFTTTGLTDQQKHFLVHIEGPHILFPFCRAIIAQTTREGGFPPLFLAPPDFGHLYQQRMQQEMQAAEMAKEGSKSKTIN